MGSVFEILESMKDKALDAAHLEKLKSAYNMQEQTIKQLRSSNESYKENKQLLNERVKSLEAEKDRLQKIIKESQPKLEKEQYEYKFFVLWDKDFRPRCNSCKTLLKPSSGDDPSRFFCSNKQCDSKYVLKDNNGKKLTYQ
jgi:predicted RNase H-like nuclease (RuvC/YqgF family)